jgi:adenylate cyclase
MVRKGTPVLRRRLTGSDAGREFSVLASLAAEGCTDYLATLVAFGPPGRDSLDGIVGSFATDRPDGFTDADVAALLRIVRRLAVACRVSIERQVTRNILTAYLGRNAGRRVRSGQIRRGDGQTIAAAIWYSDLRDSTRLAETLPATEFLGLLNRYFECTAGAVLAGGGEVLTFIGDAVLAIFPIGARIASAGQACAKATAAAEDAVRRLGALNAERDAAGLAPLHFGLGLHRGEIMFGNIGVPERLQFTAVGPAVNEVERIQTLSKTLAHPVLVSETFARTLRRKWIAMGTHRLRGVGKPVSVFAPPATKGPKAVKGKA